MLPTSFDDVPPLAAPPPVEPVSAPPSRRYRTHCEEVWAAARADYGEGWSATDVCLRYDLGLSALRTRARNEGWRRADFTDEEPLPTLGGAPEQALPLIELVELAWRRASEAIARGKAYEARVWMRLTNELRAQIKTETDEARFRTNLPQLNIKLATAGAAPLEAALHPLHPISRVQSEPSPAPDTAPTSPLFVDELEVEHRSSQHEADAVGGD